MNLQTQLDQFKAQAYSTFSSEQIEKAGQFAKELTESEIVKFALKEGDKIPSFRLPDATGQMVQVPSVKQPEWLVISFYRGEWCPFCNLELRAFQKHFPELKNAGAELIAISPQLPDKSLSVQEKHQLDFKVLSDEGNKVGKQFGLVFTVPDYLTKTYKGYGVGEEFENENGRIELPLAATYVVNKEGIIQKAFIKTDYTQRMEPREIIDFIRQK